MGDKSFISNISDSFTSKDANGNDFIQYAYNGGDTPWPEEYDVIDSDGWAQNSVMIIPDSTRTLSITMGQLEWQPWNYASDSNKGGYTKASNVMWATISTRPFTQTRVPVNINFEKKWADISNEDLEKIASVSLELRLAYDKKVDPDTDSVVNPNSGEEFLRSITYQKVMAVAGQVRSI